MKRPRKPRRVIEEGFTELLFERAAWELVDSNDSRLQLSPVVLALVVGTRARDMAMAVMTDQQVLRRFRISDRFPRQRIRAVMPVVLTG
jgi:hypothetical protein